MTGKEVVYAGIDIETGGPNPLIHPMVCFGLAIAKSNGEMLFKKRYTLVFDINKFEEKCKTEFWDKPECKKILDECSKNMNKYAMHEFYKDLSLFDVRYNVYLISDFSEFDISWVNHYLNKIGYLGINYVNGNCSRITIHTSSYYRAIRDRLDRASLDIKRGSEQYVKMVLDMKPIEGIIHDHRPENDAEEMLRTFLEIRKLNA